MFCNQLQEKKDKAVYRETQESKQNTDIILSMLHIHVQSRDNCVLEAFDNIKENGPNKILMVFYMGEFGYLVAHLHTEYSTLCPHNIIHL